MTRRYYVFTYWGHNTGGTYTILDNNESSARKRMKRILHERLPFRKFRITLKEIIPA